MKYIKNGLNLFQSSNCIVGIKKKYKFKIMHLQECFIVSQNLGMPDLLDSFNDTFIRKYNMLTIFVNGILLFHTLHIHSKIIQSTFSVQCGSKETLPKYININKYYLN